MKINLAAAIVMGGTFATIMGATAINSSAHHEIPESTDTLAVLYLPESTLVDYSEQVWYFTSDATGETLATLSGCPSEDSCSATYANGAWTVKRETP